ncbi:sigma-70 family RNA polymerase sigma factor [Cohnella pontilimi]|uniref:Sigma-70 family RNA polymerase sigma factor n=1 Tax=Cohnella pontilimi TaxID=2564100 RepID=A0A4V5LST3_9BACL|nr:sigma-70 family RNA polymerase sigma factor [Cohnella pontilimi]TJY44199.1 sigma-70 family RNA polymerase sigma factor [Cohnella pontilimi]
MQTRTDGELMRDIRLRRREALELLYDRYARLVYSFAIRASGSDTLAREIVQLVFTRLWTSKAEYDAAKGSFVNWLLTITRNLSVDVIRRERKHAGNVPIEDWDDRFAFASEHDPESDVIKRAEHSEVAAAASRLTVPQRRVIELLYWKGYTLQEIAEMGGEPLGTVKNRLHQALKTLRRHLQGLREER